MIAFAPLALSTSASLALSATESTALVAGAAVMQSASFAEVSTLQLGAGFEADEAVLADIDGDGRRDVVIASHVEGKAFARRLTMWRSASAGVAFTAGETLDLTPDVVAWSTGDVRAGGGDEIVLFNAGGAYSWSAAGPQERRLQRIAEAEFLWQLADPERAFWWRDGVRDIDGDGLVDLVLPEPDGFACVVQRRPSVDAGAWGVRARMRVPADQGDDGVWVSASTREGAGVRGKRTERDISLQIGGSDRAADAGPATLVQVNESAPAPQWIDWDGDGDLDLLAQTSQRLHVWTQLERGRFASEPTLSLVLPVDADRDRKLDASYTSHTTDLDLDHKADCVIFAGDRRSEDVRTQGLFFTQAGVKEGPELFGNDGRPSALLVFAGFVTSPTFRDLDGDGFPELVLRTVRPDIIDQLRSVTNEAIDADLYVYRNRRGTFARQPDLAWRHPIPIDSRESTAPADTIAHAVRLNSSSKGAGLVTATT